MLETFQYACLFAIFWMSCAWLIYILCKNPAIVDLAWTLLVGGIVLLYFIVAREKPSLLTYIVLLVLCIWTARLTILISYRLTKYKIDNRYAVLDNKWENNLKRNYFFFFMLQGAAAVIITFPALYIMSKRSHWLWHDWIALSLVLVGLAGVCLSDWQLQSFIGNPDNKGQVCQKGLWNYSRHPNYFFEWIYWVGIFVFTPIMGWAIFAILSPVGLLMTLLFFTGIPPAERQSLDSKGDAYRRYQSRTNAFIPWCPKRK